jgi:CheY-like chemotaxis protein
MPTSQRKVLIADDTQLMRKVITQICEEKGFAVLQAEDGEEAVFVAGKFLPDMIVLDINMPKMDGVTALQILREDTRFQHTTIVMLSGEKDRDTVVSAIQSGANDYIVKDNMGNIRQKLEPYLQLLSKPPGQGKRVLVVDDTRLMRHVVGKICVRNGCEVIEAENGIVALALAIKTLPDLIVMDVMMPKMNGMEALKEMRAREALLFTPVVMLTAEKDIETIQTILSVGVADYILKEDGAEVERRLTNYLKLIS